MKPARRDLARVKTAMLIIKGPLPAAGKYTWFHLIYKRTNLNLKKKKKSSSLQVDYTNSSPTTLIISAHRTPNRLLEKRLI